MDRIAYRFLWAAMFLMFLCAVVSAANSQAAAFAGRIEIVQTPHSVSVGLRDFDLVKRSHPDLRMEVTFLDAAGKPIGAFAVDYAHEATPSHVVFVKDAKRNYARATLKFSAGGALLFEKTLALPPPAAPAGRVRATDKVSHLVPGRSFDAAAAPKIALPDYEAVETWTIPDPPRTVDIRACRRRVVAPFNLPTCEGNATPISRQTAHPADLSKKSLYVPVNSILYDPKTGAYESTFKYLVEIPIAPAWARGDGALVVEAPADSLRIHMTTEKTRSHHRGMERLTGEQKGLLGQTPNAATVDEDGNLYFHIAYRSPVRFNVRKAKWEAPPTDIYDFLTPRLPKLEDLPYKKGLVSDVRKDSHHTIYCHNRRVWIQSVRYQQVGGTSTGHNSLFMAAVVSIPIDHWDDKDAFDKATHLNAVSWPGTDISLWSTHVQKNDNRRRLQWMMFHGNRIGLFSYHRNYFWIMDVNEDGSTRKLTPITHLEGKPIGGFKYEFRWLFKGDALLGLRLEPILKGEKTPRPAFIPTDGLAPTTKMPAFNWNPPYHYNKKPNLYNSSGRGYGMLVLLRYQLADALGLPRATGKVTIYYDAVTRMKAAPGPFQDVIARMSAASMGPEYYVVETPGDTMEVLGSAEYPTYYLARYDCSSRGATVAKTPLIADLGEITTPLGLSAQMGPYCHRWIREGSDDILYYSGYHSGLARLVYRRNGRIPDRFTVESFKDKLEKVSVDGAPDGYFKWFRDMTAGLGDKIFVTGVNNVSRGGNAYSGGLAWYHRGTRDKLYKLSGMSRTYSTNGLADRMLVLPDGSPIKELYLKGLFNAPAAETLPKNSRPIDTGPRLFVYRDHGGDDVRDIFGLTIDVPKGKGKGIADIAVCRNGLYLLALTGNGCLVTFDPAAWQFVDAVRIPGRRMSFDLHRRSVQLLPAPDGAHLICLRDEARVQEGEEAAPATSATFVHIEVSATGGISLASHLRCTFADADRFHGPMCFLYDSENEDGSYDAVIGPYFRRPEGSLKIIRDFLPPRAEVARLPAAGEKGRPKP